MHLCPHSHAIITGGINPSDYQGGDLLRDVFCVEFEKQKEDDMNFEELRVKISQYNQNIQLDVGRMMHQSQIVKVGTNWLLLLIGGKVGATAQKATFTSSVIGYFINSILSSKSSFSGVHNKWLNMASMNEARSDFTSTVFDGIVYVWGGISGQGKGDQAHIPLMASSNIERFDPLKNVWEILNVQGPSLASFGCIPLCNDGSIHLIAGGSDGESLSDELWELNYKT